MFIYDPPAEAEALGNIAVFLDTSTLPDALRYFGALIAGAFRRTYYTGSTGMQRSFAKALRTVNDTLAQEAKSGTGQWIGMLRALVVASDGQKLMMATTGGLEAHLSRQGHTMEIPLEAGEGTRPFGSYTEGDLHAGDVLLAGRRGFAEAHDIMHVFGANPTKAVKLLRKADAGALLMQTSGSERKKAPATHATPSAYRAAFVDLVTAGRRGITTVFRSGKRLLSNLVSGAAGRMRQQEKQTLDTPKAAPTKKSRWQAMLRLPSLPRVSMKQFSSARALIGTGIVILGIGSAIVFSSVRATQQERHQQIASALALAQESLERGETQIILGDTDAAIDAFTQGLFALEGIEGADEIRQQLHEQRNELQGILTATVTPLLSFSGFPVGIEATYLAATTHSDDAEQNPIALAGRSHPAVWLNDLPKPTDGTFAVLPLAFRNGILDLEVFAGGTYAVLTPEGVALVNAASRTITAQFVDDETSYRLIGAESGTAFLLADDHTIDSLHFPDAEDDAVSEPSTAAWLLYADDRLSAARDMMSVAGEPYVLLDDNTFLRFRRGRSTIRYTVEGFSWNGSATAFTPFGEGQLLVLDSENGRVLLCELNGDIIEQYELPEAEAYYDITVANNGSNALILTDAGVLRLEFPQIDTPETEQ